MKAPPSKLFGELDTVLGDKHFRQARIQLTFYYLAVVFLIVLGFSIILFLDVQADWQDNHTHPGDTVMFLHGNLPHFLMQIALIDTGILFTAGIISYVMAGFTLRAIGQVLDAQKKFTEQASHELRTPLAIMRSELEVLMRAPEFTREEVTRVTRSVLEEIRRVTMMTEDLLTIARGETSRAVHLSRCDITSILALTQSRLEVLARQNGVDIRVMSHGPCIVKGHEDDLSRALLNITENALRHTPLGGVVEMEARVEAQEVKIEIRDTGKGMSADVLGHMFDRFYKGAGSTGTGLGLAITRAIILEHNGRIFAESQVGKGTQVSIYLPHAGV